MKKFLPVLIVAIGAAALVWRSGAGALSEAAAREQLQAGALLVDVRTPAEFGEKKLPGAINIPLDTIQTGITNHVTDKSKVVLLHCRTGRRSGIAEKELRALGYTNVFNLGSFEQAQKVVR
jgi:phage shock protein E